MVRLEDQNADSADPADVTQSHPLIDQFTPQGATAAYLCIPALLVRVHLLKKYVTVVR